MGGGGGHRQCLVFMFLLAMGGEGKGIVVRTGGDVDKWGGGGGEGIRMAQEVCS